MKLLKRFGETSTHLVKTFFIYGFIALTMIIIKILIARLYGQEELGVFTYFFSIVSLIFLFTSFGFPEAVTQIIVKEKEKLKSATKNAFLFSIPFTIGFLILVLIIDQTIRNFWLEFIAYIITYTFFYIVYSILRGYKKFVEGSFYSLLNRILFITFIILIFFFSDNFRYVLLSMSLALILATAASLPRLTKLVHDVKESIIIHKKQFFFLAFSLFLMQVGFYSLRFISEIVIGKMVDFNSLGLYSAYSSIANVIRLIAYVFPVVVLPMAVISKYKLKTSLEKILMLLLPFSAVVLISAQIFVPLFYGTGYYHPSLAIFLVISSTLLVIYSYLNSVFVGENKFSKRYIFIIGIDALLSLIVNTGLNILFILKWGIIGAPIATAITIIFKILLNGYGIKRLRRENAV